MYMYVHVLLYVYCISSFLILPHHTLLNRCLLSPLPLPNPSLSQVLFKLVNMEVCERDMYAECAKRLVVLVSPTHSCLCQPSVASGQCVGRGERGREGGALCLVCYMCVSTSAAEWEMIW